MTCARTHASQIRVRPHDATMHAELLRQHGHADAGRIASTSSSVSGVRVRLLGSAPTSSSGSIRPASRLDDAVEPLNPHGSQPLDPWSSVPVVVNGVHQSTDCVLGHRRPLSAGFHGELEAFTQTRGRLGLAMLRCLGLSAIGASDRVEGGHHDCFCPDFASFIFL